MYKSLKPRLDKEIAEIGEKYGIEVPFMRPEEFAQDRSTSYDAILHAVEWLKENEDYEADWIILLEPTAPARQAFHIQEVARLINEKKDFDSLIGISEMPHHFRYAREFKKDNNAYLHSSKVGRQFIPAAKSKGSEQER